MKGPLSKLLIAKVIGLAAALAVLAALLLKMEYHLTGRCRPTSVTQDVTRDVTDEIFEQATEHEGQGKLEQALALYSLVLQKEPERESASLRLSSLLYRQGRYREAAEILRRAVKARESAVLRNNLGTVYLAQGKLNEARQELAAAAAMDEAYADPHYNLACYYVLSGQHQEGLAELERAKGMNPQVMEWAAQDVDLAALRAMPEYTRLTE